MLHKSKDVCIIYKAYFHKSTEESGLRVQMERSWKSCGGKLCNNFFYSWEEFFFDCEVLEYGFIWGTDLLLYRYVFKECYGVFHL